MCVYASVEASGFGMIMILDIYIWTFFCQADVLFLVFRCSLWIVGKCVEGGSPGREYL